MKTKILLIGLLSFALLFAGCKAESKADFIKTANTGSAVINGCTIGVTAGVIKKPKAEQIEIAVRTFENCMIGPQGWYWYAKDPNDPNVVPPDILLCSTETLIEILVQAKEAGVDVPEESVGDVNDIDFAKDRLESACNRYYLAVDNL